MPKREELSRILYDRTQSYNLYGNSLKIEGIPVLLRSETLTQEELAAGNKIKLFALPDGKTFISKVEPDSEDAYTVGRITPAHIYLDDEMTISLGDDDVAES